MYNMNVATIAIIVANVLVSLKGFNDRGFFERYKFSIKDIHAGQKDRMFTSGFLHVDVTHLLFNMLTLYIFANVVINVFGPLKFVGIYIISLAAGSLLGFFFHKNEPYYSAVGASGAVTGILYAAILLRPYMIFYGFLPAYVFGIGYLLYSIYGMKSRSDNIGHTAHFGGAIGGFVSTLLLAPALLTENSLMVGLLAVPIVILFAMEKTGKLK